MDRSHVKDILPKRIEEYMREAEQDLKVDEMNIRQKVLLRSSLGAKWCRYSFEQEKYKKVILKQVDKLREQIKQKIYKQKANAITNNAATQKLINLDTQRALMHDPEYLKLKECIAVQDDVIRLINQIQKQISMFSYDLNNAKQIIKLEQF